jgi:hypothetical protein
MSHDWWSPEVGLHVHWRSRTARIGAGSLGSRGRPFGNEFGTNDRDLAGGVDAQPDLAPFQPDHGYTDVIADKKFFHQLPRQHQHGTIPRWS